MKCVKYALIHMLCVTMNEKVFVFLCV